MDEAHSSGELRSWSLDLIQNLPNQTLAHWDGQLDQALASRAPHLSIYDLSVEPGTVFARLAERDQLPLPEEDLAVELLARTSSRLAAAGLSRYEISNYARPGHASRHNRVYWSSGGWWGFGMGATSAPWGERLARPRTREGYRAWLASPDDALVGQGMPADDRLLVGLRRREGVDLSELDVDEAARASLERRWMPFIEAGLLQRRAGRWQLRDPEGMSLSNRVMLEVVLWWEELEGP
jgi:oxygen-independent coproporphyrinogen-3 oxidase